MRRFAVVLVGVSTLTACTPQEAIGFWFREHAGEATAVAECESGLNPAARSAGGGNHGLFQINGVHRSDFERVTGEPWSRIYEAEQNARFARWLFDQQGWEPWTCQP